MVSRGLYDRIEALRPPGRPRPESCSQACERARCARACPRLSARPRSPLCPAMCSWPLSLMPCHPRPSGALLALSRSDGAVQTVEMGDTESGTCLESACPFLESLGKFQVQVLSCVCAFCFPTNFQSSFASGKGKGICRGHAAPYRSPVRNRHTSATNELTSRCRTSQPTSTIAVSSLPPRSHQCQTRARKRPRSPCSCLKRETLADDHELPGLLTCTLGKARGPPKPRGNTASVS